MDQWLCGLAKGHAGDHVPHPFGCLGAPDHYCGAKDGPGMNTALAWREPQFDKLTTPVIDAPYPSLDLGHFSLTCYCTLEPGHEGRCNPRDRMNKFPSGPRCGKPVVLGTTKDAASREEPKKKRPPHCHRMQKRLERKERNA